MDVLQLNSKLNSQTITTDILLGTCKLLDSNLRQSCTYLDPRYFPFYYHIGNQISPKNVIQFGSKLGLIAACFMQSCKSIVNWITVEKKDPQVPVFLIESNLKKFCKGSARLVQSDDTKTIEELPIDLGIVSDVFSKDELMDRLTFLWSNLNPEGLIIVDYIDQDVIGETFRVFCKLHNRESVFFKTRYGVAVVQR